MAALTVDHVFNGTPQQVFAGIKNFAEYPNYLPGVTAIGVLPAVVPGSICQVRYELKIIKTFYYTLNMFEEQPRKLWWTLDSSNIMKKSNGYWELSGRGQGQTAAVYSLDVAFKGLVPQAVIDQVTKANLPSLMSGMQKLVDHQSNVT